MKKLFLFFVSAVFSVSFAACSSPQPQVTVTHFAEVTVTLSPPPTFTVTSPPTLTPTSIPVSPAPVESAPSPEQIATVEEINGGWNGVLTIKPETFDPATGLMNIFLSKDGKLSAAGEGPVVEGAGYNPLTGKIVLRFWSDGLNRMFEQSISREFVKLGYDKGVAVNVKNIVGAFTLNENGQLENVRAIDNEGETKIQIHTPLELNTMIDEDHSTDPHWDDDTVERLDELLEVAADNGIYVLKKDGYYLKIQDLEIKLLGGNAWGWNKVYVWSDETQDFVLKNTSEYRVISLDSTYYPGRDVAVFFWMGKDGIRAELVAGLPYMNRMGHQYGEDAASLKLATFGRGK